MQDYDDAVRELQNQLNKGISFNEVESSCMSASSKMLTDCRVQSMCVPSSYCRRHNVEQWLHKDSGHAKIMNVPVSALMDLVGRNIGGDEVVTKQSHNVGNYEIVAPPLDILPGRSKLLVDACQMYFIEVSIWKGSFQVDGNGKQIVKWLLDEIYHREKEAERSLMHRLTERCKFEGQLSLLAYWSG